MKKRVKDFCVRGMMMAWIGPVVLAIVYAALQAGGVVDEVSVNEMVTGIVSITIMVFVAAGVSIVYQIESIPKAFAGLIQAAVLYVDYLGIYLLNGWIPVDKIWAFTLIFAVIFVAIWFGIYFGVRHKVDKMNRMLNKE